MTEATVSLTKNTGKYVSGRKQDKSIVFAWQHNLMCHRRASAKWYYHLLSRKSCELRQYQGVRLTDYERRALSHFR